MGQRRHTPGSVLAASLAIALVDAAAGPVTAEARLGPISVQLIDLDATDLITPSISFVTSERGAEYALAGRSRNGGTADFWFIAAQPNAWADFKRAEATGASYAEVKFTSPGSMLGSTMLARTAIEEIQLPGTADIATATAEHEITLNRGRFVLSPNTKAVFSAQASIQGSLGGSMDLIVGSTLGVSIRASDAEYFASQYDEQSLGKILRSPPDGAATSWEEQRLLSVSVVNLGSSEQTRYFGAYLSASSTLQGPVRPVPEAGSLALILLGLAGFAIIPWAPHRIASSA